MGSWGGPSPLDPSGRFGAPARRGRKPSTATDHRAEAREATDVRPREARALGLSGAHASSVSRDDRHRKCVGPDVPSRLAVRGDDHSPAPASRAHHSPLDTTKDSMRETHGKSRAPDGRMSGSGRTKPNGRATRPFPSSSKGYRLPIGTLHSEVAIFTWKHRPLPWAFADWPSDPGGNQPVRLLGSTESLRAHSPLPALLSDPYPGAYPE